MTPSRWSLRGVTSGGDLYWAFWIYVHIYLNIIIKFILYCLRNAWDPWEHANHSTKGRHSRLMPLTVAIACLKLQYLHTGMRARYVSCLSPTTPSSKGIRSESHSKICHWLFSIWLTSSIMCWHTFTNLLLNVKSLPMMSLAIKWEETL